MFHHPRDPCGRVLCPDPSSEKRKSRYSQKKETLCSRSDQAAGNNSKGAAPVFLSWLWAWAAAESPLGVMSWDVLTQQGQPGGSKHSPESPQPTPAPEKVKESQILQSG